MKVTLWSWDVEDEVEENRDTLREEEKIDEP